MAHRMVQVDASRPALVDGFTKKTFTAMIESVRQPATDADLIEPARFVVGIADLLRTTEPDGTFGSTVFKAAGEA